MSMSNNVVGIFVVLVIASGVYWVSGVNLYVAEKPLSTDNVDLEVVGRTKRDLMSPLMPKYYDLTMHFGGKSVNARLKRQDVISGLVGQRRVYKKDWATYASEEVDGVFLVHRREDAPFKLTIEGYMMHDRTPFLLQPHETSAGHVIHKLDHRSNDSITETLSIHRNRKQRQRRETGLLDGRELHMKTKVIVDVAMREFIRFKVGGDPDFYIHQYYAMLVTFVNRRFASLRRLRDGGTNIFFVGVSLHILNSNIPGVVSQESSNPHRRSMCASTLMEKFSRFTQFDTYDQVLLMSGYDLMTAQGTQGLASKIGSGCVGQGARSVVHFTMTVETLRSVSHSIMIRAIACSFGVKPDGDKSDPLAAPCPSSGFYIMAPLERTPFPKRLRDQGHWWMYSPCTNNMLRRYLKSLSQDRWRTCLRAMAALPQEQDIYIGYRIPLDRQCQYFIGSGSFAKKSLRTPDTICSMGVTCVEPVFKYSKLEFRDRRFLPLPGTPCGPGKLSSVDFLNCSTPWLSRTTTCQNLNSVQ